MTQPVIKSLSSSYLFKPQLIPTLVSLPGVLILLLLCAWQISRHFERNIHVEVMEANRNLKVLEKLPELDKQTTHLYRRFHLKGKFIGPPLLEGGRAVYKKAGYSLFQVFETLNGSRILVNRGDLQRFGMYKIIAQLPSSAPHGVQGQLRPLMTQEIGPPVNPEDSVLIWSRDSISKIHHWVADLVGEPKMRAGVYLRLGDEFQRGERPVKAEPSLLTGYVRASTNWNSAHYAVQWFGMACILFGFWVWASLKKTESRESL